jgi:hypothetical protein
MTEEHKQNFVFLVILLVLVGGYFAVDYKSAREDIDRKYNECLSDTDLRESACLMVDIQNLTSCKIKKHESRQICKEVYGRLGK